MRHALLGLILALSSLTAQAATCESLPALTLPGATLTSAAPASTEGVAFCKVKLTARPVSDSEIGIEVWLPAADAWNGKLLGTGNGGYSSALSTRDMSAALAKGYAVAGSDTGHAGGDLRFGVGHPEKITDWADRAVHLMTGVAKLTARNYYGRFPTQSYFSGCSTGGQQALTEAQRYPTDYDGIIAGDPGHDRIHLNIGFLWSWLATHDGATEILTAANLQLISRSVLAACDKLDGQADGLIDDPRRCRFDPATLLCKGAADASCLTAPQVEAVNKVYQGAKNPRTGAPIFSGWIPGSEPGWTGYFVGHAEPARVDFWRYWIFGNPAWSPANFDFDRDVAWADAALPLVAATNANLSNFRKNKGKLILYQGWADPVVPPAGTIAYYEAIQKAMGGAAATSDFARLFMVPGMGHCQGGPGPNTFDALSALDQWVTKETPPASLIASHSAGGKVDRTRPLCPYPQVARLKPGGSPNDAAGYVCALR